MAATSTRVALSGGAYVSRDVIANAQACVNLFGEKNAPDAPVPMTYYPTPGLASLETIGTALCRGIYVSGFGTVFGVFGATLIQYDPNTGVTTVGTLQINTAASGQTPVYEPTPSTTPVRMQDNGLVLLIVDGTASGGWYVALNFDGYPTGPVTIITDPAWQGSVSIGILDTFFILNAPNTAEFYLSPSNYTGNSTPFDPLYVAKATAYPDNISAIVMVAQLVWIIGQQYTEVWYDAGAADFPLARTPGVLIPYGTSQPYSIATIGGSVFWIARDAHGKNVAMMGTQYAAERISTHALENLWAGYAIDAHGGFALGSTYQQGGHAFYVITFPAPTGDTTWCYDLASGEWHQRMTVDAKGAWHAWLGTWVVSAFDQLIVGSYTTGQLYTLQNTLGTDDGLPIQRVRSFPHLMSNGARGVYRRFGIDLDTYGTTSATFDLAYSWDRGMTFPASFSVTVDASGQEFPSIFRLGMGRDRVFQVSWTDPNISALNGAFVWADAASS